MTPQCPPCGSTEQPTSVLQEFDETRLVVLYSGSCGVILAAAGYGPHYSASGSASRARGEEP